VSECRLTATLPIPPSTNHLYDRTMRGVYLKDTVRRWRTDAAQRLDRLERWPAGLTCAAWSLDYVLCCDRRRDLDNAAKALIDLIAAYLGINDDCLTDLSAHKRVTPRSRQRIEVTVTLHL